MVNKQMFAIIMKKYPPIFKKSICPSQLGAYIFKCSAEGCQQRALYDARLAGAACQVHHRHGQLYTNYAFGKVYITSVDEAEIFNDIVGNFPNITIDNLTIRIANAKAMGLAAAVNDIVNNPNVTAVFDGPVEVDDSEFDEINRWYIPGEEIDNTEHLLNVPDSKFEIACDNTLDRVKIISTEVDWHAGVDPALIAEITVLVPFVNVLICKSAHGVSVVGKVDTLVKMVDVPSIEGIVKNVHVCMRTHIAYHGKYCELRGLPKNAESVIIHGYNTGIITPTKLEDGVWESLAVTNRSFEGMDMLVKVQFSQFMLFPNGFNMPSNLTVLDLENSLFYDTRVPIRMQNLKILRVEGSIKCNLQLSECFEVLECRGSILFPFKLPNSTRRLLLMNLLPEGMTYNPGLSSFIFLGDAIDQSMIPDMLEYLTLETEVICKGGFVVGSNVVDFDISVDVPIIYSPNDKLKFAIVNSTIPYIPESVRTVFIDGDLGDTMLPDNVNIISISGSRDKLNELDFSYLTRLKLIEVTDGDYNIIVSRNVDCRVKLLREDHRGVVNFIRQ